MLSTLLTATETLFYSIWSQNVIFFSLQKGDASSTDLPIKRFGAHACCIWCFLISSSLWCWFWYCCYYHFCFYRDRFHYLFLKPLLVLVVAVIWILSILLLLLLLSSSQIVSGELVRELSHLFFFLLSH